MHSTSLLTKTAYDRYLRHGVTDIGSPTMLGLKQAPLDIPLAVPVP